MRILAVDYGLKKIGLAITEGELVEPLAVIERTDRSVQKIARICQEKEIDKIVVGLPEGKLVATIKQFAQQLAAEAEIPLVFQDERLTSQEAIVKMIEAGKRRGSRQKKEDAVAAAIILQDYLETHV